MVHLVINEVNFMTQMTLTQIFHPIISSNYLGDSPGVTSLALTEEPVPQSVFTFRQ